VSRLISYAQNAEDIVLWRALGRRDSPGTYVDIGANHPTGDSVTRLFYERGWRGVNVEPQPVLHRALVEERPEDVNLNVGVSDARGTLVLHLVPGADGLSTMNPDLLNMYREQGRGIEDIEVPVVTLSEIVGEHVHGDVDFLKVDVEGHEREVLLGADWSAFRPRVIVIEATFPERWQGLLT
jgi:FkbM family methyltransferase